MGDLAIAEEKKELPKKAKGEDRYAELLAYLEGLERDLRDPTPQNLEAIRAAAVEIARSRPSKKEETTKTRKRGHEDTSLETGDIEKDSRRDHRRPGRLRLRHERAPRPLLRGAPGEARRPPRGPVQQRDERAALHLAPTL